ncbi:MAG TPA: hypothetical protein VL403_06400 [Candidatus Kryptonia bacterium]|nr:hypothetical protein [Candidatus Kryptonia bacterium]
MSARRYLSWFWMLLSLAACSGSGSSGFDALPGESAAIEQALDEQHCVQSDKLTICPADAGPSRIATPSSTPTPTATPTAFVPAASPTQFSAPTTTATAARTFVSSPAATTTATPTPLTTPAAISSPTVTRTANPTATRTATATPTATPTGMRIDTGLDLTAPIACAPTATGCAFVVPFFPAGFPPTAVFHVAVRTEPTSSWMIGSEVAPTGPAGTSDFEAPVSVSGGNAPDRVAMVQLAVLVFDPRPSSVPSAVQELGDSGAAFAFVTPPLTVQPAS